MNGIFTISLDFELHWGGFEKWSVIEYQSYFLNTRKVIPRMLQFFEKYNIHVTWAGVGMLFFHNRHDLQANFPDQKPTYIQEKLSAYYYIQQQGIGESEEDDPLHYALGLVKQILNTPCQELGSHTFAHFYCNEPGQNPEQFRADLKAAQRAASRLGQKLRSLVFPRNQFNEDYLAVCFEEGFDVVRDNPRDWFWYIDRAGNESFWKRFNRGLDAYFALGKKKSYRLEDVVLREGLPICLPASRLLRPHRHYEYFLNTLKIRGICKEMIRAAKNGEVYHLWWHPHNFGNLVEENMAGLETILKCFKYCKEKYQMNSLTMGETADLIIKRHGKPQAT